MCINYNKYIFLFVEIDIKVLPP